MKRAFTIAGVVLGLALVALTAMALFFLGVTAGTKLDGSKLSVPADCVRLYDRYGDEIAASSVSAAGDLPPYVGAAFVAVEDKRFYLHHGIDTRRVFSALWKNLTSFSFKEGASTISQQLIKNTHLSSEKTIARKLREIKLACLMEKHYTKEEILALYLNSIYFGHSAFGIESAAQFYFGKHAADLNIAESAMLAAVVRSPNRYSPFRDPQRCLARRNTVLSLMHEQGYLTEEQQEEAAAQPLPEAPREREKGNAYLAQAEEELETLFPDARSGAWGELHVYTAYDPHLQEELSKTCAGSDFCMLVRDNKSGMITALAASTSMPRRSPASTIKPLLVYAPALEENLICPATPVLDARTDFSGYAPDDYGGASGEYMSVRHALAHSVNIPAVKIFNELGIARGTQYLDGMGMQTEDTDKTLALALGGMREGFTLRQLADGYSVFSTGGTYTPSSAIVRVTDAKGRERYAHRPVPKKIFSEDVCWLMNDMLAETARTGTAKRLKTLPFPVCAKTGTAGDENGNTDAYCIGYTAGHVVAVWMGNADRSPVEATGGGLPANEALRIFSALYKEAPPEPFPACSGVLLQHFDKEAYERDHALLLADPAAPPCRDVADYVRRSAPQPPVCTRYSQPSIKKPELKVKNGVVQIVLCQEQYYDYEIIRENRGIKTTIYKGKYCQTVCDSSVQSGETYIYTVIPKFNGRCGIPVTLPSVAIASGQSVPDQWWADQASGIFSSVVSASSTSASTSSFASSSSI